MVALQYSSCRRPKTQRHFGSRLPLQIDLLIVIVLVVFMPTTVPAMIMVFVTFFTFNVVGAFGNGNLLSINDGTAVLHVLVAVTG